MTRLLPALVVASLALFSCDPPQKCGGEQTFCAEDPDGGASDAGTADSGTVDAGDPIEAPHETWTWVDFPESSCGNGAATGLAVNLTDSDDVLVYLEGGGACWNATTCRQGFAARITSGYTATQFEGDSVVSQNHFNRARADNPFRDMNYVYVPYCTGDVHAGDAVTDHPTEGAYAGLTVHHKGAHNLRLFLTRLRDTFPNAQRIFIAGSSAGAYGAQFNYPAVAAAFPGAEVHAYADCGQLINPNGTLETWVTAWGLTVPEGCTDCITDFTKYQPWLSQTYPDGRFALLAYTQDFVLRNFFGHSAGEFETRTRALVTSAYEPSDNARAFLVAGSSHVMMTDDLFGLSAHNGVLLREWTVAFVMNGASWLNIVPP